MNYSPQVGNNLGGPQKHLYVPFFDSPWGPQVCPPQMADNNSAAPGPGAPPAPPPGPFMSGALPVPPHPNSGAHAYAYAGVGTGAPPGPSHPDFLTPNQFCYPNGPPYPQGAHINVNINGYSAGYYRPTQDQQFGAQPIHPPIPVQAADGQWLAGPYNRVPVGYGGYGALSQGQYAYAGYGPPPGGGPGGGLWAAPMAPTAPAASVGQAGGSLWTGPTRAQHMQNILLRADRRPVDMCPSDPDPWRFYLVKELDGGTTSRNRHTIDSGQIGECKWFQSRDGSMYAAVIAPPPPDKEGEGDKKD